MRSMLSTGASTYPSIQQLCPLHTLRIPVWTRSTRRDLRSQKTHLARAAPEDEDNMSEILKADMERMRSKQSASPSRLEENNPFEASQAESRSPFSGFKEGVDKVLIADFFLVLVALAWLGAGVLQANLSESGGSPLLDVWFPLWPTLWQSAIGLLMAGALVSGGLGWLSSRGEQKQ
ncbi:hypothetical protein DUNSADRAFT_11054 [Dunaliella salina]|uniref:Uncharacterized protein n=1 Tax=Dunaliella salina TaxID=3046 RepID=A0ABQ7GE76_DUNSA|nr:hypothetical protein DUNSADRAFT_11054 [Dunaliella salina]|eukprot:KAF5832904.1 hypothetical protein DUNSADRAFT_11054 [Dunaliella salina]